MAQEKQGAAGDGLQSTIVIQVPRETKGRWVREARARSMTLARWIVDKVEGSAVYTENEKK